MKKLDRLIYWLKKGGFSEEVEILKEAGKSEAKILKGINFNLVREYLKSSGKPHSFEDVKYELSNWNEGNRPDNKYSELFYNEHYILELGIIDILKEFKSLNAFERLIYYESALNKRPNDFDSKYRFFENSLIKEYIINEFPEGGLMTSNLGFEKSSEITPQEIDDAVKKLEEDFSRWLSVKEKLEESEDVSVNIYENRLKSLKKVEEYEDGDYIAYIPGDANPDRYDPRHYEDEPEDLEKCYSEARKFYGDKMGNCLGDAQYHHCDSDKIYIYFSNHKTSNNPEVMINIIDGKLDQIENKYQLEEIDKKIYDRVIEFSLNNSDGLFSFIDNSAYDYFDRSSSAEKMYKEKYINTHSSQEKILSELMSYDTDDYAITVNNAMAQILAKDDSRIGVLDNFITNPKSYEFKKIFGSEKMQEVFDYYKEEGESMRIFIYLAQQNFLLDPSYDIFMKIKNNIPKDFYERLDEDTDSYWVIKLIARTKVEDFYKLANLIKEMKAIYDDEKYIYDDFCLSGVTINDHYNDDYVTATLISFEEERYKIKLVETFDYGEYDLCLDIDFY